MENTNFRLELRSLLALSWQGNSWLATSYKYALLVQQGFPNDNVADDNGNDNGDNDNDNGNGDDD